MIGTKLGPYEIVEQIGEGGMATVYRAYQPSVDRYVAVKVLQQSIAEDTEAMDRFQREAKVVARLEHLHLLPIYDFDGTHDPPYIVMRYLEGGTLEDALRQGRLPWEEVGYLLRQMAAALDYAHRQGVVHRDVKPSNIMIDGEGNAFVADFGIARMVGQVGTKVGQDLTQSGSLIGTLGYIAPEQALGQRVDHRADLYSLGVVVFEMLTGGLPYQAESPLEAVVQHIQSPVPSACAREPTLPAAVDGVLRRAMAKEPAARYATASELTEAIVAALGGAVAHTPVSLRTAVQERIRQIAEGREERAEEFKATLARFAAQRGAEPPTGLRRTPTERNKLVTVLYTNLAEYAEIAEAEDAEAVHDTLEQLWGRLEAVVAEYGGSVQNRGYDTALALWGVEGAREDDPERAIRAALEMQAVLREFSAEGDGEEPLPMQVGITTGLALLIPSDEDSGVTASGPPISLVHRLERAAPLGGILISHDTYRHVRGVFDVEAGDPLRIRGQRRRLETYVVRSARPLAFRRGTRGVEGVETRMVGRKAELERLQEAFYTTVEDGETQVVTVVGEPGLGKSRLLYEFTNWLELEGTEVWLARGRATPEMTGRPYALLRDLFSDRFGIQGSDSPAAVRAKLEEGIAPAVEPVNVGRGTEKAHFIGHLLGFDLPDSPHLAGALADVEGFHQQARHYLMQFFLHVAGRSPVVLELDGVHWADGSSLDTINHLVRRNPEMRLLAVCLARPELYERRPAWGRGQPFHTRLDLRPLSRRESRRLVREILQKADEVPDALRDLIVERAEGNPFYVEELIKMLIEDRVIVKGEPAWRVELERLPRVRVPSTLTGLIQARLDGLFPAGRAVLQRAAVVGRIFWDDAVRALETADAFRVDVVPALHRLSERGLVHVRAESSFAGAQECIFASNILRDVVYEGILGRQRRAYHTLVTEWLIERSSERVDEYAGPIADHLERAGETERAVSYLHQAGERAAAQYANDEAVDYLSRALDLTSEEDLAERYALLLAREKVYDVQGNREARRRDLAVLETLVETLADDAQQVAKRRAEVAVRKARFALRAGDHPAAITAAQTAIRLAQAAQDVRSEAQGHIAWGNVLRRHEDHEAARLQLERALALAQAASLHQVEAMSLRDLGLVYRGQGDYTKAGARFEQALRIFRQIRNRGEEGSTLHELSAVFRQRGDYARARTYGEQSLRISRETGSRMAEGWALCDLGGACMHTGDYAGAVDYSERALRVFREVGGWMGEGSALYALTNIHMRLGDYVRARAYAEQLLGIVRQAGTFWEVVLAPLGLLFHYLGDDDAAREYSQQALQAIEELDRATGPESWTRLGYAMLGLGQLTEAADAYRQVLEMRRDRAQPHLALEPLAGLAEVALAQGDLVGAGAHVEEILSYLRIHPAPDGVVEPFQAHLTCYRVLQANGDPRAAEILDAAYHLLQERAAKIEDEDLRRSYLGNVAAHREIVEEFTEIARR